MVMIYGKSSTWKKKYDESGNKTGCGKEETSHCRFEKNLSFSTDPRKKRNPGKEERTGEKKAICPKKEDCNKIGNETGKGRGRPVQMQALRLHLLPPSG